MKYSNSVDRLFSYAVFDYIEDWSPYLDLNFTLDDVPALFQLALDEELYWHDGGKEDKTAMLIYAAPYHAWRILGLLKAEVAILPLLDRIGDDDWSCEDACKILGYIGEKAIEPIKQYLANPAIDEDKKSILLDAFTKIVKFNPEVKEQCITFLTQYLAKITDKDSTLAGFVICALMNMNATKSIETIRTAFQRNCVNVSIVGDIEDVEIEMGFRIERETPRDYGWEVMSDEEFFGVGNHNKVTPFVKAESSKIGRNDPCPCGSGKKYKKCCLN